MKSLLELVIVPSISSKGMNSIHQILTQHTPQTKWTPIRNERQEERNISAEYEILKVSDQLHENSYSSKKSLLLSLSCVPVLFTYH
uniref:Putative ovule protein n=1 Tax=Solanum chacoense TaxID=4108 RepID=A0A0V0GUI6_SOLCH